MSRPRGGYRDHSGKRVRGVTTTTGRFKDSGGLIHWAYTEGAEGRDYRATRDSAGEAGTMGHALFEAHIAGRDKPRWHPDTSEEKIGLAETSLSAAVRWLDQSSIRIIHQEMALVHVDCVCGHDRESHDETEPIDIPGVTGGPCRFVVSSKEVPPVDTVVDGVTVGTDRINTLCRCPGFRELRFGGTLDAIGSVEGGLISLLDWKTGNRVYADVLYQLCAYLILMRSGYICEVDAEGRAQATDQRLALSAEAIECIRFGKEFADFHHHSWVVSSPVVQAAIDGFATQNYLYDLDRLVGKGV